MIPRYQKLQIRPPTQIEFDMPVLDSPLELTTLISAYTTDFTYYTIMLFAALKYCVIMDRYFTICNISFESAPIRFQACSVACSCRCSILYASTRLVPNARRPRDRFSSESRSARARAFEGTYVLSRFSRIFCDAARNVEQRNSVWKVVEFYFRNLSEIFQVSKSFQLGQV